MSVGATPETPRDETRLQRLGRELGSRILLFAGIAVLSVGSIVFLVTMLSEADPKGPLPPNPNFERKERKLAEVPPEARKVAGRFILRPSRATTSSPPGTSRTRRWGRLHEARVGAGRDADPAVPGRQRGRGAVPGRLPGARHRDARRRAHPQAEVRCGRPRCSRSDSSPWARATAASGSWTTGCRSGKPRGRRTRARPACCSCPKSRPLSPARAGPRVSGARSELASCSGSRPPCWPSARRGARHAAPRRGPGRAAPAAADRHHRGADRRRHRPRRPQGGRRIHPHGGRPQERRQVLGHHPPEHASRLHPGRVGQWQIPVLPYEVDSIDEARFRVNHMSRT